MKPEIRHRLFLIDDHPIIHLGLNALTASEPDMEMCGRAAKIHEALARLQVVPVDLAVLEIGISGGAGLDCIQDLKLRFPRLKTLCYTTHEELFFAERALRAGALGYVMKTEDGPTVVRAIRTVLRGQVYLSEAMGRRILNRLAGPDASDDGSPIALLSNRELQVVHHIGESRDNRQIARLMSVSVKTVEAHRSRIKEKLSLRTTSDLIRFATHWVEHEVNFINGTR